MVLYHIEFTSIHEHFEKIGITKHNPFTRFSIGKYLGYDMKVLQLFDIPDVECRKIEKDIHKKYNSISYIPNVRDFSGRTECFSPNLIKLDEYNEFTKKYQLNLDNLISTNIPYHSKKMNINVDDTYKEEYFKKYKKVEYYSIFSGNNHYAMLDENNKLYAKEIPDMGRYYIIDENKS